MTSAMKILEELWLELTSSKDVESAGPCEREFLESVYRFCYVIGLSRSKEGMVYRIYSSVVIMACLTLVCFEVMLPVLGDLSLLEVVSSCNVIIIHLMTVWKHKSMMDHTEMYKKLAKSMESPHFDISTEARKKIMEYWVNAHNTNFKIPFRLGTYTIIVWNTFPLIDDYEYNLSTEVYIPFAYNSPGRYLFTYIIVAITFVYASYWAIMSEVVMQAHLYPLICQYAVLADCFENIFEDCANCPEFQGINETILVKNKAFSDKYLERLSRLIMQHKYILNNTLDMKTVLSTPMLGQLAATGLLICLAAYQATATISDNTGKFLMSVLYLGYVMFTFFLACKSCEEITVQSMNIGDAVYSSGWESGMSVVPGVRSAIMMVIARSNKPLIFVAGGMYTLSLRSYTNLVKTSYSAFTVMLRTSK